MKKLLNKKLFTKPLALIMICAVLNLSFTTLNDEVVLKAGTNISLEVLNEINTEFLTVGEIIDFKVTKEVLADNQVVIEYGAIAKGQVTRLEKRKAIGKEASMEIQIKSVTAKDGTEVILTGGNMLEKGESKLVLTIVISIFLCPFFLFIKGGQAIIPAGTSVLATVATDSYIKL